MAASADLYDIPVTSLAGEAMTVGAYRGRVLLVVNVASRCGFTPQYDGLERLYRARRDRGFEVLGFPCNQFGGQEPGTSGEIAAFCAGAYDVTFPMFQKVEVNGPGAHPLFRHLTAQKAGLLGRPVRWNFTKFLVDRHGTVVRRYAPSTPPARIEPALRRLGL